MSNAIAEKMLIQASENHLSLLNIFANSNSKCKQDVSKSVGLLLEELGSHILLKICTLLNGCAVSESLEQNACLRYFLTQDGVYMT